MNVVILKTLDRYDCLVSLCEAVRNYGLHLALPPKGETDVVCLCPADKPPKASQFICLWKIGEKPVWKPECSPGTRIVVEQFSDDFAAQTCLFTRFERDREGG